jgi:hypothetical protein
VTNIPVIERQISGNGDCIRYRERRYGISGPRTGLIYQGYPRLDTAMMYAKNWRRGGSHISVVVKSIQDGKVVYFVYVTMRKSAKRKLK